MGHHTGAPLAVLASRVRIEEKLIFAELRRRGIEFDVVDTRSMAFPPGTHRNGRKAALNREISHTRNLYATRLLEHLGVPVVNDSRVVDLCGDKLRTTLALQAAGTPVPRFLTALTPAAALDALDSFGYPAVVKPLTGSWGRLVARMDNRDAAEAVLEHRAALSGPSHQITYIQEYVDKPDRDIKAYVMGGELAGAIYKTSPRWRTNTARGGRTQVCPPDDDLVKLLAEAAAAVGDGVLGIDVIEDRDGRRYVNEINHTPEFHGAVEVLGTGLVGRYVDYALHRLGVQ